MLAWKNLQKFLRLSWSERMLFLSASFWLPLMALGVRIFGLRAWQTILLRASAVNHSRAKSSKDMTQARTVVRLVQAASWHGLFHPNCLQQSLTIWWLLVRRGMECKLCIGMQEENEHVKGHSWVEYEGIVLNENVDVTDRYSSFVSPVGSS